MLLRSMPVAFLTAMAAAQPPVLAPTTNVTISTANPLHYASIHVPAGVTVTFDGANPALVRCDGDAIVDGTIVTLAGQVTTGAGGSGVLCQFSMSPGFSGGDAVHAGAYGSAMPFTTDGGSAGGGLSVYTDQLFPYLPCSVWSHSVAGGTGGGTLVLVANGRVEVRGIVRAVGVPGYVAGGWLQPIRTGSGSGGSLLLAGMQGLQVSPGAIVQATGGGSLPLFAWNDGYVRLDSFGGPPVVAGLVQPAPLAVELPHLRAAQPPVVGAPWQIDVHAPSGDAVVLALAAAPIAPVATPFGVLAIDPFSVAILGIVGMPSQLVDPHAPLVFPVPADPALVGYTMWIQGVDVVAAGSPRLSNLLTATIQ